MCRVRWVKDCGIRYEKGVCVVVGINTDDYEQPTFAEIKNVYVVDSKVLLEVNILKFVEYNEHFHAFTVLLNEVDAGVCKFCWSTDLFDHHVYGLYSQPILRTNFEHINNKFIVLKYNVKF